jgi:hypothetical protein
MRDISQKILVGVALSISFPQALWAWGAAGHKTVAEIAYRNLDPRTRQISNSLLGKESFVDASMWADQIKNIKAWEHTRDYHFESIADEQVYLESIKENAAQVSHNGGAVIAVLESQRVLSSRTSDRNERASALKFLIHFVGDLHQPLHSGRPEDKGGNLIQRRWNGQKTNLHSIWDSEMIETGYPQFSKRSKNGETFNESQYANFLQKSYGKLGIGSGADNLNLWLTESLRVRPAIYNNANASESLYQRQFLSSADRAIYRAGIRLATILNRIFNGKSESSLQDSFERSIEAILGPIERVISLNPDPNARRMSQQSDEFF